MYFLLSRHIFFLVCALFLNRLPHAEAVECRHSQKIDECRWALVLNRMLCVKCAPLTYFGFQIRISVLNWTAQTPMWGKMQLHHFWWSSPDSIFVHSTGSGSGIHASILNAPVNVVRYTPAYLCFFYQDTYYLEGLFHSRIR